jgi:hypothetical protein
VVRNLARLLRGLLIAGVAVFVGSAMLAGAIDAIRHPSTDAPAADRASAPATRHPAAQAVNAPAHPAPPPARAATAPAQHAPVNAIRRTTGQTKRVSDENQPWDREYARLEPVVKKAAGARLLELGMGEAGSGTPDYISGKWLARLELYEPRDAAEKCGEVANAIMARRPEITQVIASAYSDRQQDRCVFSAMVYPDGHEEILQAGPVD